MVKVGELNRLRVLRRVDFGMYLDDGKNGILLPNRYIPSQLKPGDDIEVFVYHDGEDRLIATTERPKAMLGDMARLKAVSVTPHGAFLDWGLPKDIFVPISQQLGKMVPGGEYLVQIVLDAQTGRLAATEKFQHRFSNENLTVSPLEEVDLTVIRRTDIGYLVAINNRHTGVLHFNEIYRDIRIGDTFKGFIKQISDDGKIDVAAGKPGYARVEGEGEKILRLLKEHNGYLPYFDKSDPEEIYQFFGMSKKTFKMAVGQLYKQRKISIEKSGIKLTEL